MSHRFGFFILTTGFLTVAACAPTPLQTVTPVTPTIPPAATSATAIQSPTHAAAGASAPVTIAATKAAEMPGAPGLKTPITGGAIHPAQVLNLINWKITLPIGASGDIAGPPVEIVQPRLNTYSIAPYFIVSAGGNAVQFRAPVKGATTSNSSYPRSELREMTNNGTAAANWSAIVGTHTMYVCEAITHLPDAKSVVMAAQIHDDKTKVVDIRLSSQLLYVESAEGKNVYTLDPTYVLGRIFTFRFVAGDGQINVYYNDGANPVYTRRSDSATNYFKAGVYTQSNCENETNCSASNYGEVLIYQLEVTHQ